MAPYLFVLPNMVIFGIFTIWPAINGFNLSFYDTSNGRTFTYVGTENYQRSSATPSSGRSCATRVVYTVGFVLLSPWCRHGLALLLNAQRRGRGAFSAAYFLPFLISPVVVGLIWRWRWSGRTGLVDTVLGHRAGPARLAARARPRAVG